MLDCLPDEAARVLQSLQELIQAVSSPILKVCLQEAHADIAHLVGAEDQAEAEETDSAAA